MGHYFSFRYKSKQTAHNGVTNYLYKHTKMKYEAMDNFIKRFLEDNMLMFTKKNNWTGHQYNAESVQDNWDLFVEEVAKRPDYRP